MDTLDNALLTLGVAESEVVVCRLLAHALNSRRPGSIQLLSALRGLASEGVRHISAYTEVLFEAYGRKRRADLLVDWQAPEGTPHRLVVEAKIHAGEGVAQTDAYLASQAAWCNRTPPVASEALEFLYLTLTGEASRAPGFQARSLSDLSDALAAFDDGDRASFLAHDLGALLRHAHSRTRPDQGTPFATAFDLARGPGIDVRYPLFRSLTQQIADRGGFEFHGTHRGNNASGTWFGAQLARPGWYYATPLAPDWHDFDPRKHWWLHYQIRIYLPQAPAPHSLAIAFFAETLPYASRVEFDRRVTASQREAYVEQRDRLKTGLRNVLDARDWRGRGTWCQLLVSQRPIDPELSLTSTIEACVQLLQTAADAVDPVVAALRND